MADKTHNDMRNEVMKKLKHGQVLRIHNTDGRTPDIIKARVVAFYPDFVLCQGDGYKICYRYYDLWIKLQHKQTKAVILDCIKG